MLRSLPACMFASLSLLACEGLIREPGEQATTGSQTGDESSSTTPTTGAPEGTSTAPATTTAGTASDSDDGTTDYIECPFNQLEVRVTIPQVMLVLDKSGSMANEAGHWDHDGDDVDDDGNADANPNQTATPKITRWQSLHETVAAVIDGFEPRVDFGAVLFPAHEATGSYGSEACLIQEVPEVPVGPDQGALILATIPAADSSQLFGGTPATAGIRTGRTGLADVRDPEGGTPQYLVLVTDGAANCPLEPIDDDNASLFEIYDEQLPVVVADALADGIPTFVVGIAIEDVVSKSVMDGNPDATNTFARLNEVAEAGGKPRPGPAKFHDASNQLELQAALLEIYQEITSCTLPLSQPVAEFQFLREVEVGGPQPLEYDGDEVVDCASESGWHYTDATRTAIELCGDACAQYKVYGMLDIIFDCERI